MLDSWESTTGWERAFSLAARTAAYDPKGEICMIDLDAQNRTFETEGIGGFNGWRQPFCARAGGTLHRKGLCAPSGGRPEGSGSHAHSRAFPADQKNHHCDIIGGAGRLTTPPDPIFRGLSLGLAF